MARVDPTCALVLWDERLSVADIEPNTAAALTSSYSEGDKRPGLPVRMGRLLAQVSGDQDATVDLEVATNKPGFPGRSGAMVRTSADGGTTWRGHQRETEIRWYEALQDAYGGGSGTEAFRAIGACVSRLGTPIVSAGSSLNSVCSYFNGAAWVDSTGTGVNNDDHGEYGIGLCVDPVTGTIVMLRLDASNTLRTYHSTDDGVSFDIVAVSDSSAVSGSAGYRIAMAATRGGIVALVQTGGTAGDVTQMASSDLGLTWYTVDTASAEGLGWSLTTSGDVIYSFCFDPSTAEIAMTRTVTPYESIPGAATTAITSRSGLVAITAWADVAGTLHCLIVDNGVAAADGPNGGLVPFVSYDNGVTWSEVQTSWASDATNVGPRNMVGMHTPYGAMVACNGKSPSNVDSDNTCHMLWLGGWSTIEWAATNVGGTFCQTTGTPYGVLWLPFSAPGGVGMTVSGSGSGTLAGGWYVVGDIVVQDADGATQAGDVHLFDFKVVSGGSVTSFDIGFRCTYSTTHEVTVRASETQFRVYDNVGAAIVDTVTVDMTERMQFLVTRTRLYYKRPTDIDWTAITLGLTSGTAPSSRDSEYSWGVPNASDEATWFAAGISHTGFWDAVTGQQNRGHTTPCYLPTDIGNPSILTLQDGPGVPDDTCTVEPRSLYSIHHLDPVVHPSPDVRWRSTQTANAEHIVWDLGDETELGRSVALVVAGASMRQARIGYYDGASWQTAATLDLATGFVDLSYELDGDILEPDSGGTTSADRYIAENELVGGYVIIDPNGTPTTHRILSNTAGLWDDASPVVPSIRIANAGSVASTGEVTIVAPGGVCVASPSSTVRARYWRIRFVAGQDCPDDRFEAGVCWLGRVVPFGAAPDWTWSDTSTPNISRSVSPYGTARTRKRGPVARAWTWSWADGGTDLSLIRAGTAANGVGIAGGRAAVVEEDVWWQLRGIFQTHQALPVAALRVFPESGQTITDPSLWLYGYLDGSVAARNAVGTEGDSEIIRVDGITVREQK